MTNVNANIEELLPQAGADLKGRKLGFIDSAAMAAQNDTVTILNGTLQQVLSALDDTTGDAVPFTVSGNVITLTGTVTGAKSFQVLFK